MSVLSIVCREKSGSIRRYVRVMYQNEARMIYDYLALRPSFVSSEDEFVDLVKKGMVCFLVDDVGMFAVVVDKSGRAHVHMTFWDGRLRGRETLAREVAHFAMETLELDRLWTAIPLTRPAVLAFAERVGFKRFKEQNEVVGLCYLRQSN